MSLTFIIGYLTCTAIVATAFAATCSLGRKQTRRAEAAEAARG